MCGGTWSFENNRPSITRHRVRLKAAGPPINPDFDGRTFHLQVVPGGNTFFTSVAMNHLFGFETKYPQYRPLEGISPSDGGDCRDAPGGIDEDKVVRDIKVRSTLSRSESVRAGYGDGTKQRVTGNDRDPAVIENQANIPLNPRLFSERGVADAGELRGQHVFRRLSERRSDKQAGQNAKPNDQHLSSF